MDIDASEFNKNRKAHLPVVSDIKDALHAAQRDARQASARQEAHRLARADRRVEKEGAVRLHASRRKSPSSDHMKDHLKGKENEVILPQMVVEALYELTKGEAIITTGVGQHQMWAGQCYKFKHPRQFITSGGPRLDGLRLSGRARRQGRASRTRR